MINSDKSISKPFLKSSNPLEKKWIICFKYKNSNGDNKEYKRTFDLNKPPYVIKGIVNDKANIIKARIKRANIYLSELAKDIDTIAFNVDAGDFEQSILDLPFKDYLDEWLQWKKNIVSLGSYKRYKEKVNVLQDYLTDNKIEHISLKKFDYTAMNNFLLYVQDKSSNTSYNYYLTILKNIYKYLIKIKAIKGLDNVTDRFTKLKIDDSEKHIPYSDVQLSFKLLNEYSSILALLAKCIFYTLHRIDTLTQLQFKDFDLDKRIINIPSKKIKTKKKLTIRISQYIMPELLEYIGKNQPQPNDYFFGNNGFTKNSINLRKTDIRIFGQNQTPVNTFTSQFRYFKERKSTDNQVFTNNHTLYGFKHSGIGYYIDMGLSDKHIIKITGHANTGILATYSRMHEAKIPQEIWDKI